MKQPLSLFPAALAALSLAAAVAASATLPAHASTFSVGGSGNQFIITRSGEGTNAAETVLYRTVGLSACANQNFNARSGELTFAAGQTAITNTVTEASPANSAYWFQSSGTTRSYKLEVTDRGGFFLASRTRTISTGTGTQLSTSYLNIRSSSPTAGTLRTTTCSTAPTGRKRPQPPRPGRQRTLPHRQFRRPAHPLRVCWRRQHLQRPHLPANGRHHVPPHHQLGRRLQHRDPGSRRRQMALKQRLHAGRHRRPWP